MSSEINIGVGVSVGQAIKEITKFSDIVESETTRVVTTLGDSKLQGGFGKLQEGFDVADTRAMGFRDTLTGVQDTMAGFNALTTSTADATKRVSDAQINYNDAVKKYGENSPAAAIAATELANAQEALGQQQGSLIDKMFLLGTGVGDLASGMANFIVPLVAVGAGVTTMGLGTKIAAVGTKAYAAAQWLLNAALTANPIGIVVVAVAALAAAVVIAYKKSDTFRSIVQAAGRMAVSAFKSVLGAVTSVVNWIKGNWPLLLSILTGPIGIAVRLVTKHFDTITAKAGAIPGKIRGVFSNAGNLLTSAGSNILNGLWNGLKSKWDQIQSWFRSITNKIPNLKGPADKDRKLLVGNGQLVMGGFLKGLMSEEGRVRSFLGGFTDSLSPAMATGSGSFGGRSGATVNINVRTDVTDTPEAAGKRIEKALNAWLATKGKRL